MCSAATDQHTGRASAKQKGEHYAEGANKLNPDEIMGSADLKGAQAAGGT